MARESFLFTSESVSEGHPDKISDRISDSIVDLFLRADPLSRTAIETLTTTNLIVLAGETRGPADVPAEAMEQAARRCVREIGYARDGVRWDDLAVLIHIQGQSAEIRQGDDAGGEAGGQRRSQGLRPRNALGGGVGTGSRRGV